MQWSLKEAMQPGQMILKSHAMSERANARPLCIIDDNPNKWGRNIGGVPLSSVAVIALWKASKSIILIRSFLQFQLHHLRTKGISLIFVKKQAER